MNGFEKREHTRLPIKLDVLCRRLGASASKLHVGTVVNIAAGGLYFELAANQFEPGDLAEISIEVPADTGRLQFGGTMRTVATVVRTDTLKTSHTGLRSSPVHAVALKFRRPPKFSQ